MSQAFNPAVQWFERHEFDDGVSLLREPHVHPFFRCNIWLVQGRDCDLLIDSGMGLRPLAPQLRRTSGKPLVAVATHAHVDHIGSLHEFDDRRAHGCAEAACATMPDDVTLAHLFRDLDAPVSCLPSKNWSAGAYRVQPAPLHATLEPGASLDLGDRSFRLLHLPGHSPDSMGFFDEANGVLFSGDALYDGTLVDDFPHSDVADYEVTMALLADLPINIGHGGHGPSFNGARKTELVADYLAGRRRQGCPAEAVSL